VLAKLLKGRAVVAHAFNPSTWEAEAGGFLSSRPAWSREWVPGQPGLHRETLSRKTNKQTKKQKQNKTKKTLKGNLFASPGNSALVLSIPAKLRGLLVLCYLKMEGPLRTSVPEPKLFLLFLAAVSGTLSLVSPQSCSESNIKCLFVCF
jgi:hypothetical protein